MLYIYKVVLPSESVNKILKFFCSNKKVPDRAVLLCAAVCCARLHLLLIKSYRDHFSESY